MLSAEADMRNHNIIAIPAENWAAFEAWLTKPAKTVPSLAELAKRRRRTGGVRGISIKAAHPSKSPEKVNGRKPWITFAAARNRD